MESVLHTFRDINSKRPIPASLLWRMTQSNLVWLTRDVVYSVTDVHYKYYMVVSPLDGRLYITDQQNLRIIRVKTMGAVRELTENYELVAGNGQQCIPGDIDQCGDGSLATNARLYYPKGNKISPSPSVCCWRIFYFLADYCNAAFCCCHNASSICRL